jgi:hypothetical protein
MGEIADDVIEGFRCQACADIVDHKRPGYPRFCWECSREALRSTGAKPDHHHVRRARAE